MRQREPNELIKISDANSSELQLLKTRYNRYAEQMNSISKEEWSQEDEALAIELEYIKRDIKKLA